MNRESSIEEDDNDEEEPAPVTIAPKQEKRKKLRIKKRLDEFVLLSSMYDQNLNYSQFAKTLINKKSPSGVGLPDTYNTLVHKAKLFDCSSRTKLEKRNKTNLRERMLKTQASGN